jgi:predicted nucleic acid-binding protein
VKIVVDASVFLAFAIPEEKEHGEAARFFARCETEKHQILFPTLALAEVAGGVARRKRDPDKADLAVSRMHRFASARFFPLTEEAAGAAAKLAGRCFLRGADAVYCQLAREKGVPLVTFDLEIRERLAGVVTAFSPQSWLESLGT